MINFTNKIIRINILIIILFIFVLPFINGFTNAQGIFRDAEPVANPSFPKIPVVVEAPPNYVYQGSAGLQGIFSWFGTILSMVLPLIIAASVVWFVYSVFRYTISDYEAKKEEARDQIIWGIVGIFVMVSVWGLVGILRSTFNLNNTTIQAPVIRLNN